MTAPPIFFSDYFAVPRRALDTYGAFDINLLADVRLFVDPFLIFNSRIPAYQELHEGIIKYVRFLKSIAGDDLDKATVKDLFRFQEVKQNWFGYCELGNDGRGLGQDFATAMRQALGRALSNFGEETGTRGSHLEKVSLIRPNVGKDNISDFTTNLIKHYLVDYTEAFAKEHIDPSRCAEIGVSRVRFNYDTETWVDETRYLPMFNGDYVLLTPTDMLIHDNVWINHGDMVKRYPEIVTGVDDDVQRAKISRYFEQKLGSDKNPSATKITAARRETLSLFPELLDVYIRLRERDGDGATAVSDEEIGYLRELFVNSLSVLVEDFWALPEMANRPKRTSLDEVRYRVDVFKHWVEDQDGYRSLNSVRGQASSEKDVQRIVFLALQASRFDANSEVNNGRGPVDFKVSAGSGDSTLLEIKLASNTGLKRNLQNQLRVYEAANKTAQSITMIVYYSAEERARVAGILRELGLTDSVDIVLVNARNDDKPSGSRA